MNSKKRAVWFASVVLAIGIGGMWIARKRTGVAPLAPTACPAGVEHLYDLRHMSATSVPLTAGGQRAHGRSELEGTLRLRAYGSRDGACLMGASLTDMRRHTIEVLGSQLLKQDGASRELIEEREVFLLLESTGKLRALLFPPDSPQIQRQVMQWLALDLQVELPLARPSDGRWRSRRETQLGTIEEDLQASQAEGATVVQRKGVAYRGFRALGQEFASQDLTSHASIELAPQLRRLESEEQVTVRDAAGQPSLESRSTLIVRLLASRALPDGPAHVSLNGFESRAPDAIMVAADTRRRLLDRRIDGLDWDQLVSGIQTIAKGGGIADQRRWLWRATGRLLRDPQLCARLEALFPLDSGPARELVFDLLASVGARAAQETMRNLLARPELDPTRQPGAILMQRLSVLEDPDPATVRLVAGVMNRAGHAGDPGTERSAEYVLGSMVRRLNQNGEIAAAESHNAMLLGRLGSASSPEAKAAALHALGNVGAAANRSAIAALASNDAADVRRAVAVALRHDQSPEARAVLVDLASDGQAGVQSAAMDALARAPLDPAGLERLTRLVEQQRLPPRSLQAAVSLAARTPTVLAARKLIESVAAASPDPGLRARARGVLAGPG
jgi:hypothetical protein